jgi:hypothetical protein
MLKTRLPFMVFLVIMSLVASGASGAVIGSYTVQSGPFHMLNEDFWTTNLWFSDDAVNPNTALFNGPDSGSPFMGDEPGIDILSNVGRTFWIASDQDDPEFSRAVTLLTDDVLAYVWIYIGGHCIGTGYPVGLCCLLDPSAPHGNIKNLHGYTIDRIGLTITSASYTIDPQSAYPHIYSMAITCIFEGAPVVPEPTPHVTLIAGIGAVCGFRYRRRRKQTS